MDPGRARHTGPDPRAAGGTPRAGAQLRRRAPAAAWFRPRAKQSVLRAFVEPWTVERRPRAERPPQARNGAARPSSYSLHRVAQVGEHLGANGRVVPGQFLVADDHALFVALAREQDRVVGSGAFEQEPNRGSAV